MTDYEIQGPARVCAASGRELKPGDRFHAVLAERDGTLVRTDYAADAWPGPPEGAIAHWAGRVPASDKPRKPVVNDDVLLGCFERLRESADESGQNFRYVAGRDVLILKDAKGGAVHEVIDPRLGEEQLAAVQAELFRVLGWE